MQVLGLAFKPASGNKDDARIVAVLVAGAIGHAYEHEYARSGYLVHLDELTDDSLKHSMDTSNANLDMLRESGLMCTAQAVTTVDSIRWCADMVATVADTDVVVEVVSGSFELKLRLWCSLDSLCPACTVFVRHSHSFRSECSPQAI
ncbi:MAG: hypothetical protein JW846_06315 [Dehalococcoidia bacterium]|nr:hypothetical protein [Dehalococcoidia bacterium]